MSSNPTHKSRRSPHRPGPGRLAALRIAAVLVLLGWCAPAQAANAYVQFKNKLNPLFISNIRILHVDANRAIDQLVVVIPEQLKYERYSFDELREIEFLSVVGERKMAPAYQVKVYLRQPGVWRKTILMPIREFQGSLYGAPWVFRVDSARGYEENAEDIQSIRFVPPDRSQGKTP